MQQIEFIIKEIGGIIAIAAFIISIVKIRQDLHNKFFQEYTKRYSDIMLKLPFDIHFVEYEFKKLDKAESEILKYIGAYFDLCSEEYHLFLKKKINKKVWNEWKTGISNNFSKKSFINAWIVIKDKNYTSYYPDFTKLVENDLLKNKPSTLEE